MGLRGLSGSRHCSSTVLGSNHACIGVEGKDYFLGVCVSLSSGQGPRTVPLAEQGRLAPCPLPIPPGVSGVSQGSVAPCCCCPDCVSPTGLAGVTAGGPQLVPRVPSDPPHGPTLGRGLPHRYPHHPCTHFSPVGGTAGRVGLVQGALPVSCLHPPQTPLPYTCSPSGPPSSLGRHLCLQPTWQRAPSVHCFHPNPTISRHPVSPGVPGPPPAPGPLPSVPSAASLGMAPCARAV